VSCWHHDDVSMSLILYWSSNRSIACTRGFVVWRIRRRITRRACWWRRRPEKAAGAMVATMNGGGELRLPSLAWYRARGRGKRGPGGPPAHPRCDGGLSLAGGGTAATGACWKGHTVAAWRRRFPSIPGSPGVLLAPMIEGVTAALMVGFDLIGAE
jgi:hypothetical protein